MVKRGTNFNGPHLCKATEKAIGDRRVQPVVQVEQQLLLHGEHVYTAVRVIADVQEIVNGRWSRLLTATKQMKHQQWQ